MRGHWRYSGKCWYTAGICAVAVLLVLGAAVWQAIIPRPGAISTVTLLSPPEVASVSTSIITEQDMTDADTDKDKGPNKNKQNDKVKSAAAQPAVTSSAVAASTTENTTPITDITLGVYNGPGKVAAHSSFEQWMGRPVTYATDYIDYKGGWQKDFVDSGVWLTTPWSKWVSAGAGRRLVLGLPMLQNENYGQFQEGINGQFDSYFLHLANELVRHNLGNSIIRLGYEANCDTIGPWQATNNPEGYRQLFRYQVGLLRSVSGANFTIDWTVCNGLQDGKALNSYSSFYPGDDVVDIIGIDIYDVKWQDTTVTPQQRWDYAMNRYMGIKDLLAFAAQHGKPVSYPEWGLYKPGDHFAGGGDNPYFIYRMADLIRSTRPVYQSYFNLDWGSGVLADFPNGQAVYRQIFGG